MTNKYPKLVERQFEETDRFGQSYEEANWAKLAPHFRAAHNRLRVMRGLAPIPEPKIDLYKPPAIVKADPKQLEALAREQGAAKAEFLSGGKKGVGARMMAPGREGFTINGEEVKF